MAKGLKGFQKGHPHYLIKHTEESKKKIGVANKINSMGNHSHLGHKNTEETKQKMRLAKQEGFAVWVDTRIRPVHLGKPEFIQFQQEGENIAPTTNQLKGTILLSENLKSLEK